MPDFDLLIRGGTVVASGEQTGARPGRLVRRRD